MEIYTDFEANLYAQEMNEYLIARLSAAEKKIEKQQDMIKRQRKKLKRRHSGY